MTCGLFRPLLPLPYDLLEDDEAQGLRRHLDGCARCVADREALSAAIARACPTASAPPPGVWQGVAADLEADAATDGFAVDVDALLAEKLQLAPVDVVARRAHDPLVGTRVGTCVVLERLGIGGMGAVYRGYDPVRRSEVALKSIHRGLAESDRMLARFKRHGAALERLVHPNVVQVFEPVQVDSGFWTLQEYVRGKDLSQHMKEGGRCAPEEAVAIAIGVARALRAAHREGVLHRDVKPGNILLTDDGRIKLLGFGMTPAEDEMALTKCGAVLGNPHFMAPELIRGDFKNVDGRADLYSLGGVLYALLTGRFPCVGQTISEVFCKIVQGEISPPAVEIPAAHQRVLAKLLACEPANRYEDADALINDLEALLHDLPVAADEPLPWLPKPWLPKPVFLKNTSQKGIRIALLGLGLVILVILIAWLIAT